MSNASPYYMAASIRIVNPSNTTGAKSAFGMVYQQTSTIDAFGFVGGKYKGTNNAITAIRLRPDSGTLTSGYFILYKLARS